MEIVVHEFTISQLSARLVYNLHITVCHWLDFNYSWFSWCIWLCQL